MKFKHFLENKDSDLFSDVEIPGTVDPRETLLNLAEIVDRRGGVRFGSMTIKAVTFLKKVIESAPPQQIAKMAEMTYGERQIYAFVARNLKLWNLADKLSERWKNKNISKIVADVLYRNPIHVDNLATKINTIEDLQNELKNWVAKGIIPEF